VLVADTVVVTKKGFPLATAKKKLKSEAFLSLNVSVDVFALVE
jgi:hypothetical protein